MKSIYELEALKRRGINPATLGCVMLEVEPIDVRKYVDDDWAYFSINPDHQWIDGIQTEHHITLLYGLLENANTIKDCDVADPGFAELYAIQNFIHIGFDCVCILQ